MNEDRIGTLPAYRSGFVMYAAKRIHPDNPT
jgi:hypothetical protein